MTQETTESSNEWEVLTYPDKRLRVQSEPITEVTDDIRRKGLALMDLMHEVRGIGLAAPQVGWPVQIIAINLSGQRRDGLIFVNPKVTKESKAKFAAQEMCLSIPRVTGKVIRSREITATCMNFDGDVNEFHLDGLLARCFLHEYDHLQGILFVDRLSAAKKLTIKKKLRELGGPE